MNIAYKGEVLDRKVYIAGFNLCFDIFMKQIR